MKYYTLIVVMFTQLFGVITIAYAENLQGGTYTVSAAQVNTSTGTLQGGSYVMQGDTLVISGAVFGGSMSLNTGYDITTAPVVVPTPTTSSGGGGGGGGGVDSGSGGGRACPVTITPTFITDIDTGAIATIDPGIGYTVLFGNVEYKTKTVINIFPRTTTKYSVDVLVSGKKYRSCIAEVIVNPIQNNSNSASCFPFKQKLKMGAVGPEVRRIQVFLKSQGYTVDKLGVFGRKTHNAVKQFQQKYFTEIITAAGLRSTTGLWYASTINKANKITGCSASKKIIKKTTTTKKKSTNSAKASSVPDVSCQSDGLMYRINSSGPEVRRIQKFLSIQGYPVPITGKYTFETGQRVADFQQQYFDEIVGAQGFRKPTGIWGQKTIEKAKSLGLCEISIDDELETQEEEEVVPVVSVKKAAKVKSCLVKRIEVGTINSDEVRHIQRFLIAQGYANVRETGNYVADTIEAIKDFQTRYADEILIPQGFDQATGVWAVGTAMKANKLGLCNY